MSWNFSKLGTFQSVIFQNSFCPILNCIGCCLVFEFFSFCLIVFHKKVLRRITKKSYLLSFSFILQAYFCCFNDLKKYIIIDLLKSCKACIYFMNVWKSWVYLWPNVWDEVHVVRLIRAWNSKLMFSFTSFTFHAFIDESFIRFYTLFRFFHLITNV